MNPHELLEALKSLGMDVSGISPDMVASRLNERVVLKKFEGDNCEGTPTETIVIENGKIISQETHAVN